jgi:carboxymethylenebutenolidase
MQTTQWLLDMHDGPMPVYEAVPDATPKGGIVVIQEAFGVTRHIEEIVERLADEGWHALAPALYYRQGSPVFAYDDLAAVMPAMQELTSDCLLADVQGALGHLETAGAPPERQGVVGFCMGGTVAFFVGAALSIGAAVTWYGGGISEGRFGWPSQLERAPDLQTPWLGLYGDLDKGIPPEQVDALRAAAATAKVATEVVRYGDADHGFNCNDRPAVYNAAAAADGWQRTLNWFDTHLAPV